jgi:gamma-glutamyltranspeptidase/glutathione hydrolase
MAPTMVFDVDGKLELVVGSPGGSRIICYVVKTLVGVIDWGLDVQTAVDAPNICNRNGTTDLERGTVVEALAGGLAQRGHEVAVRDMNSGLHAIHLTWNADTFVQMRGGADRRREGMAAGH